LVDARIALMDLRHQSRRGRHGDDKSLMTDEPVDYIHETHTWSPELIEVP